MTEIEQFSDRIILPEFQLMQYEKKGINMNICDSHKSNNHDNIEITDICNKRLQLSLSNIKSGDYGKFHMLIRLKDIIDNNFNFCNNIKISYMKSNNINKYQDLDMIVNALNLSNHQLVLGPSSLEVKGGYVLQNVCIPIKSVSYNFLVLVRLDEQLSDILFNNKFNFSNYIDMIIEIDYCKLKSDNMMTTKVPITDKTYLHIKNQNGSYFILHEFFKWCNHLNYVINFNDDRYKYCDWDVSDVTGKINSALIDYGGSFSGCCALGTIYGYNIVVYDNDFNSKITLDRTNNRILVNMPRICDLIIGLNIKFDRTIHITNCYSSCKTPDMEFEETKNYFDKHKNNPKNIINLKKIGENEYGDTDLGLNNAMNLVENPYYYLTLVIEYDPDVSADINDIITDMNSIVNINTTNAYLDLYILDCIRSKLCDDTLCNLISLKEYADDYKKLLDTERTTNYNSLFCYKEEDMGIYKLSEPRKRRNDKACKICGYMESI